MAFSEYFVPSEVATSRESLSCHAAPGATGAARDRSVASGPSTERLQIPVTRQVAAEVLPQFEQRCVDAFRKYAEAKRALQQARGELAVVKDIAAGEFQDAGTYAVGSRGAWRVDP